ELLERQTQLSQRHGRLGPILERAESEVGAASAADGAAEAKPDERAEVIGAQSAYSIDSLGAGDTRPFSLWSTRSDPLPSDSAADRADRLFVSIN
ncbi:M23 family peptidase, partial [Mesorhizobium sp. M4B.F.Ca.ET.211.01.1.1]